MAEATILPKLKRLIGRLKEKMSRAEYYMMVAVMAFPLGVIVYLEFEKLRVVGACMAILAILSWVLGLLTLQREEKRESLQRMVFYKLLEDILQELKGLREDKNEQNDTKK